VAITQQTSRLYEFGSFRIDTVERVLFRDGEPVPLTPKVFDILLMLIENAGHVVEKDRLMIAIWPDSFVEEGNLTQNISTLRKALGEGENGHECIQTIARRGYRFVASVREVLDEGDNSIVEEHSTSRFIVEQEREASVAREHDAKGEQAILEETPAASRWERRASRLGVRTTALTAFVVVAGLAVALYFWITSKPKPIGPVEVRSIAVLPFKPGAEGGDEYLGFGMTDTLITKLSNVKQLIVRPTSAISKYTGQEQDPVAVGREQKVDSVLEGRIRVSGDKIRVTVQLVSVRDGRQLWGDKFDEKLTDIFTVEDSIAERIAGALALTLTGEEKSQLAKHYTENIEAYQAYLEGRYYSQRRTEAGIKEGVEYFDRAIKIDPSYAPAYVGEARAYYTSRENFVQLPEETRQRIESALLKALELDGTLAEAHALLGAIRQDKDDWPAAEKELKRAIELNSNAWGVRWYYSRYLTAIGRNDEAIAEASRMVEIDPLSPNAVATVGFMFLHARKFDQAIVFYHKSIEMDPTYAPSHTNLARAYVQKEMYEDAIAEFQKAMSIDNFAPGRFAALAYTYAMSEKRAEAQKMLAELHERAKYELIAPVNFAIIYTGLGEKDRAFEWLEKAYKDRSGPPYLAIDLMLDRLRSDPRFADFARRKGLAA